jgi:peptidoglycan/LPS O-acetylase OafA/YrhL
MSPNPTALCSGLLGLCYLAVGREGTQLRGNEARRSPGLDTLRGCAVLAVLCFHYLNNTQLLNFGKLSFFDVFISHFYLGVDMFFVLSGFLIGSSLLAAKGQQDYFFPYFCRRIGRIFPLYYLWLAIFFFVLAIGGDHRNGALWWLFRLNDVPGISYVVFLQNFADAKLETWGPAWLGITWTVAIEVQFYILVAFLIYVVPMRWIGAACLAIIAASAALKQFGSPFFTAYDLVVSTPARLDGPFIGVLCAWLIRSPQLSAFIKRYRTLLKPASVALIVMIYASFTYNLMALPMPMLTMSALVCGLAVLAFAGPEATGAGRSVRILRWCGVRCYAIYLFHTGVLGIVSHMIFRKGQIYLPPGDAWPAVLIATPMLFGLVALSWRYFERPIIDGVSGFLAVRKALRLEPRNELGTLPAA